MQKLEASVSGTLPRLAALPADILRFVRRPDLPDKTAGWSKVTALLLLGVIAIDILLDNLIQSVLRALDGRVINLPEMFESDVTTAQLLLSFLVLAPLVEEAMFRGWMSGRKASLRFAAWGLAALLLALSGELVVTQEYLTPITIAAFGLAGIGFGQWVLTYRRDAEVPGWFQRHFHWLVWASAIAFGLFHLGNYMGAFSLGHVLIVSPAILGGLLLAYTRTRFGLRAAIAHHAIYNAVYLGVTAIGS
ncbi:CPBP family glutamic-type intramembrane protease [Aurantiacibacter sp. D1-12]|uniref:CPBP family glutamic-type intramembrane protease n=1 Tax=Aurantiacibacter sp. D1-12 TaxID=2993658 RepID=UPI00237CDB0C|nr:CPBP family glutamic-type intramembrane protease [Aurantiacibacter sp. D1-12]MDE1467312.1 CPBP family glutamic-type intramembrane protease [Aurantiacibacter sp. D1-12]